MSVIKEVSKGGNVTWYINQEKGVVTAKIDCMDYEPFGIVESIVRKIRLSDIANTPFTVNMCVGVKRYTIKPCYIGCARCSPEDTFDINIGKRIALAKAQARYHQALYGRLCEMSAYFCSISQLIEQRATVEYEQSQRYEHECLAV